MDLDFNQAMGLVSECMEESKVLTLVIRKCTIQRRILTNILWLQFIVKSFTGSGLEYVVDIDVERSLLLSCTCADYFKNGIPCKHLYLIVRIFNVFEIKYTPDPEPALRGEDDNNNDQLDQESDPPIPAIIPPRVQLLIQAERAKEREALKRKREEEVQESFRECDARLKELWVTMASYIYKEGTRKCRCQ